MAMVMIDFTIVSISVTTIQRDLHLSATAAQEAAGQLEDLDLVKNREKVQAAYALLEREAQKLKAELGSMLEKTAASSEAV